MTPELVRKPIANSNLRCHWCNLVIPSGKPYWQVRSKKAAGDYHNGMCYQSALSHYESVERQEGLDLKEENE